MLDIKKIRENAEVIQAALSKRGPKYSLHELLEKDKKRKDDDEASAGKEDKTQNS